MGIELVPDEHLDPILDSCILFSDLRLESPVDVLGQPDMNQAPGPRRFLGFLSLNHDRSDQSY